MKKHVFALVAFIMIGVTATFAQGYQRQTPEERTKSSMEKLASLALTADQTTKATAVFTDFYTSQQTAMEEMRASGNGDREAFMAKRKELSDIRDAKLKAFLTEDQFKKFKDEIEPALMPQRRAGGN